MRILKSVSVFIVVLLLGGLSVIAVFSGASVDRGSAQEARDVCSSEDLVKRMFLFGRVQTLLVDETFTTIHAVHLWIVFFRPFQVIHYTNGEQVTFLNHQKGLVLAGSFVLGVFTVVLPMGTNSIAVIDTSMGTILVELYEKRMPNTTANFIRLAKDGFYDGLVFHRVIDDFVIQGGGYDPNGTLHQSPYGPIDLEIHPEVRHLDGTIGMARTSDPDSATSQFFINDGPQRFLEPGGVDPYGYAAFGRVVKGIEVVRAIAKVQTTTRYGLEDWPVEDVIIEQVWILSPAGDSIAGSVNDVMSVDVLTGEMSIVSTSTRDRIGVLMSRQ